MNHNLETVPRLYQRGAAGRRLRAFARAAAGLQAAPCPDIPTKSGLMVGLGETDDEILEVMRDLRAHDVDMLTIGQYLQPRPGNLPVLRYVQPARVRGRSRRARGRWASRTRPAVRWCVPATTPTARPRQPAPRDIEQRTAFDGDSRWTKTRPGKPLYKSLYFQVITAIVIGVLLGHFYPETGDGDEAARRRLHQADQDDHRADHLLHRRRRHRRHGGHEEGRQDRRPMRCCTSRSSARSR